MRESVALRRCLRLFLLVSIVWLAGACNLQQASVVPSPTPSLPTAEFLFPSNNSRIEEGTELDVDLLGRDLQYGVARIELYADDVKINDATPKDNPTVPEFRVTMNWTAEGIGMHTLRAVAYRLDGTASDDALIVIEVVPSQGS